MTTDAIRNEHYDLIPSEGYETEEECRSAEYNDDKQAIEHTAVTLRAVIEELESFTFTTFYDNKEAERRISELKKQLEELES